MTPFDPHPAYFDPNAFPSSLRIGALFLSVVAIGVILFEAASATAAVGI